MRPRRTLVVSLVRGELRRNLVGVLFRVVKSQAADREIDDVMAVTRSRPG